MSKIAVDSGVKRWVIARSRMYLDEAITEARCAVARALMMPAENRSSDAVTNAYARLTATQTARNALDQGRYGVVLLFLFRRWKYLAKMAQMLSLFGRTPESRYCQNRAKEGKRLYKHYPCTCTAYA